MGAQVEGLGCATLRLEISIFTELSRVSVLVGNIYLSGRRVRSAGKGYSPPGNIPPAVSSHAGRVKDENGGVTEKANEPAWSWGRL